MKSSIDTRLRLIGPPILFVCGTLFFRLNTLVVFDYTDLYRYDLVGLLAGYVNWHVARWVLLSLQKRYPGIDRTRVRLVIYGLALPLLVLNGTLLRTQPLYWLGLDPSPEAPFQQYVLTAGIQLFHHCIYLGVYESIYLFGQWQLLYTEKERLLKAEWQARFDAMKSQVNPHFLFNALNSLSALIDESPVQAGRFVDELAQVYRYLLQANDRELITLDSELRFIQSYTHLLQTRHGSGITVHIDVDDQYRHYSLPPLTLQLLMENAVKHNTTTARQPLTVEIRTTENGRLQVCNNIQRKKSLVLSNGVGLRNIAAKYQLLTQATIGIDENNNSFTVTLPLLGVAD
ncbi:hypothetical protein GO755_00765 [Spirosoma sp. HMF4905]|uniref:Signal transduction histidine kinase internal region domain-containing protein n=1 Tax=Spirosoma arboris TaxID=2682092 RepID=A0A7K1S3Z1_9BACT|nr:histidine kinase [Spirosoma arboris]MVM28543.1 hypothetical protein [Spirosoma arboris]